MNHNHIITRRAFAKKFLGATLPILWLPASSVLAQSTPVSRSGVFDCHPQEGPYSEVFVSYFLDGSKNPAEKGSLIIHHRASDTLMTMVEYRSALLNGNEVTMSAPIVDPSARTGYRTAVTVPDFAKSLRIVLGPKVKLILPDGRSFEMEAHVGSCFLSTACLISRGLPDDCHELQTLRYFRDGYLREEVSDGPELIRSYYEIAPGVVREINALDDSERIWNHVYHTLVSPTVAHIQAGRPARAVDHYTASCIGLASTIVGTDPKTIVL